MNMKRLLLTVFAATAFMASSAMAGELRVGTGGPTGNYFGMANDIKSYCESELGVDSKGQTVSLDIQNSGGSIANLIGMGNKKFAAGLVQEDVLQYMAKKDPNVNQTLNHLGVRILASVMTEKNIFCVSAHSRVAVHLSS